MDKNLFETFFSDPVYALMVFFCICLRGLIYKFRSENERMRLFAEREREDWSHCILQTSFTMSKTTYNRILTFYIIFNNKINYLQ